MTKGNYAVGLSCNNQKYYHIKLTNKTIIGGYEVGSRVNIEVDLLARYLERLLARDDDGVTMDFLKEHGYGG